MLTPGAARSAAVRDIGRAAGNRIGTGRPAGATAPNTQDQIREAHKAGGWNAAWQFAIKNIDQIAEDLNR